MSFAGTCVFLKTYQKCILHVGSKIIFKIIVYAMLKCVVTLDRPSLLNTKNIVCILTLLLNYRLCLPRLIYRQPVTKKD